MDREEIKARESLVETGILLAARGLAHGSSGNLSLRLADGWLVTPTNSRLGKLDPTRLSKLDTAGRHVGGDPPSKEAFLHTSVYAVRPDATAIVHTHATHSVALSCLEGLDESNVLPPITAYAVMKIGRMPLVPYYRPGDTALASAVREMAMTHAAVLLANHGPVIAGRSLDAAVATMEELEETAKLYFLLQGHRARPLTPAQVDALREAFPS